MSTQSQALKMKSTNEEEVLRKPELATENPLYTGYLEDVVPTELTKLKNEYLSIGELEEKEFTVSQKSKKSVTEVFTEHRKDIPQLVTIDNSVKKRFVTFNYPVIFGRTDMDKYEDLFTYDMSLRTYQALTDQTVNDINFVLNEYPELAFKFLSIRTKWYRDREKYNDTEFFKDIRDIVMDEKLRSIVKSIIEDTYELSLDARNESSENKNAIKKELQVTDRVNKSYLSSAFMQRLIIPVACQYFIDTEGYYTYNSEQNKKRINSGFIKMFTFILSLFSKEYDVNNINKLYKIVEPRVIKTNYNDRVIWNFLKNRATDNHAVIDEITTKLIRQIIVKLKPNSSAISFFDGVIKFSIDYKYKYNYSFSFKPLRLNTNNEESDDDIDEMDRISMKHHHKENELALMIHKITMKDYIQNKIKEHNISEEEINAQYKRFNQINDFQKTIMNIFYSKHFKIIEYNRIDIVRLLIIMGRELAEKDINTIAQLVTAKVKSGD